MKKRTFWTKIILKKCIKTGKYHGKIERYNMFYASLLIRWSNYGKMYLYDIIDIKNYEIMIIVF